MNSRFKFPRRVRIHGGECGAVARALHHEAQKDALMSYEQPLLATEKAVLRQADSGKALGSTLFERKQMSTKTTLKRIALVAVTALGFGLLSMVPAKATISITSVTPGTPGAARVGATSLIPVKFNFASDSSDSFTVGMRIVSAPAASNAIDLVDTTVDGSEVLAITADSTGNVTYDADTTNHYSMSGGNYGVKVDTVVEIGATAATSATVNFDFTPDVDGTYSFLVWAGGADWAASYKQSTVSVTVAGGVASIAITKIGSVIPDVDETYGALVAVSLKDAAGNATKLGAGESLVISDNSTDTVIQEGPSTGGSVISSLSGNGYNNSGTYYARIVGDGSAAASATVTLTVSGSGGLVSSAVTANTTLSLVDVAAADDVSGLELTSEVGYSTTGASALSADYVTKKSSHTFTVTATEATADVKYPVVVTLNSGLSIAATVTLLKGDTEASLTVSAPTASGATSNVTVMVDDQDLEFAWADSAAYSISVQGYTTVRSAAAASNKFTAKVIDQYAAAMANVSVSVSATGRNTVASTVIGSTDADGLISYTLKDVATTGSTDTLSFACGSCSSTTSSDATVIYGDYTVGSITVSGGSKAETIAGSTKTAISAADNGPEGSAVAIKAVVKDANGNLLSGVPVAFSVDTGLIKKTSAIDYALIYTNASGEASTYAFAWLEGKQTITATAGGKSGTDYLTWDASDATSARVLSGKVTGNIISLTVKDRFGNGVEGVTINLTRTGTGLFGNGSSTQNVTTDENGTADVSYNGSATVKAKLGTTYTQAYDVAGEIDETAVTAAVSGTTKGTGASLAPLGVNTVSLTVSEGADAATTAASAAADAAAEAIDAANAATDAANLAAEAADAATVAAEEARDAADAATAAVEELATQVATLMAALKAQITTLANTVAKIAKKVKA